ncbi:MAG: PAS domain S-box protein [Xanthomonadales bacterium]|nr:PAS domain S-box protein [Xanthomonadales bacterium]
MSSDTGKYTNTQIRERNTAAGTPACGQAHPFVLQAARTANHADTLEKLFSDMAGSACDFIGASGARLCRWLDGAAVSETLYRSPESDEKLLLVMQASGHPDHPQRLLNKASSQFQQHACLIAVSPDSHLGRMGIECSLWCLLDDGGDLSAGIEFFLPRYPEHSEQVLDRLEEMAEECRPVLRRDRSTASLDRASEREKATWDASADAILVLDRQGGVIDSNHAVTALFGLPPDQLVGINLTQLLVGESSMPGRGSPLAVTDGKPGRTLQVTATRSDGSRFPAALRISPCGAPEPDEYVCWIRDLSTPSGHDLRFQALCQESPDAVWVVDGADGQVLEANPAFEKVFGSSTLPTHLESADWVGRIGLDFRALVIERRRAALRTGQGYRIDYAFSAGPGDVRWLGERMVPVADSGNEPSQHWVVVTTDRTGEHVRQRELKSSRLVLEQLSSHLDEVLWLVDPESEETLFCSQSLERVWGVYAGAEIQFPGCWRSLVDDAGWQGLQRQWQEAGRGQGSRRQYPVIHPSDGHRGLLELAMFPVTDESGRVSLVAGIAAAAEGFCRHTPILDSDAQENPTVAADAGFER